MPYGKCQMNTEWKCVVLSLMCLVGILGSTACAAQKSVDLSKWELVWQDEFADKELDAGTWTRCKRGTPDWKNTMSDDPRLLKIENGVLHLRGIANDKKDEDPAPYLTAGVTSRGKFAHQYGKVQIRARFKSAQGAWPALWMLGAEKGWPASGESGRTWSDDASSSNRAGGRCSKKVLNYNASSRPLRIKRLQVRLLRKNTSTSNPSR